MVGALKDLVFAADLVWSDGKKDVRVSVKLDDMSMFSFDADTNISGWLDRSELDVSYSLDNGDLITYVEAKQYGVAEFCLRLLLVPTVHTGASVNVAAHPSTKDALKQRLGEHANCLQTPHISLQVQEVSPNGVKAGRAAHALFTRQELANDGYGLACLPWLECSAEGEDEAIMPEGDEVKEAMLKLMKKSTAAALSTTVKSLEVRVRALLEGKAAPLKNSPLVFPDFSPSVGGAAPVQG